MTPNVEMIDKIIDAIHEEDISVNMDYVVNTDDMDCGTVACIMGFYNLILSEQLKTPEKFDCHRALDDLDPQTQKDFGMDQNELRELFYASISGYFLKDITEAMALAALEDVKKGEFESWNHYDHMRIT
tara:strand:+ start:517 stop:903 length:387 start_codon:yes stop_codon:yes gene_type:complete